MADLAHRFVLSCFEVRPPFSYRRNLFIRGLFFGKGGNTVAKCARIRFADVAAQCFPYELRSRAVFLSAHALEFARHFRRQRHGKSGSASSHDVSITCCEIVTRPKIGRQVANPRSRQPHGSFMVLGVSKELLPWNGIAQPARLTA